jgi:hypothetical protein
MTADKYTGKGKSQVDALRDLRRQVGEDNIGNYSLMYQVTVKHGKKQYAGPVHDDYNVALAQALSAGSVSMDDLISGKSRYSLDVVVTGMQSAQFTQETQPQKPKGKPSGAAPSVSSGKKLTDLF